MGIVCALGWLWGKIYALVVWAFANVLLRTGPIPRHVYIIMDGNRRWAKKLQEAPIVGHKAGYEALLQLLEASTRMGVREMTVFAFGIANFQRPPEEKAALMGLAKEKFLELLREGSIIDQVHARIRIIGNLDLLSDDVRALAEKINARAAEREPLCKHTLSIAFPYSAQDEMRRAMLRCIREGDGAPITIDHLNAGLDVPAPLPGEHPPLLVRTSGERRFSHFLTWQCSHAILAFEDVLWPDFKVHHLLQCIWRYQRALRANAGASHVQKTA